MFLVNIGEKIKKLRVQAGWNQKDLARKAKIDFRQVSRYESGDSTPTIDVLRKIANAFGVSTDYLIFDEIDIEKHLTDPVLLKYFKTVNKLDRLSKSLVLEILEGLLLKAVSQGKITQQEYQELQEAS